MWARVVAISTILTVVLAETTAPGIQRSMSENVNSLGYKIVYGDEDMAVINEVVSDVEKSSALKSKINLIEALPPLPAQDVKCLMSVDRYCSKEMGEMKAVLIQAIKEDCKMCSIKQKEEAGKVIASMMAHDPTAWKLFLTRSALQIIPDKKISKLEEAKYKLIGEPELIDNSRNRYTLPGVKVRVKRYQMEKI